MSIIDQISGLAGGLSGSSNSQDQAALNQGVGVVAETTFQMMMNQLMQTTSQFQETMQDDDDPNADS
jgi:hypothetical protein